MSGASLSLVVIRTAQLERLRRFYTALGLAFVTEKHGAGPEHLACDMGSVVVAQSGNKAPAGSMKRAR